MKQKTEIKEPKDSSKTELEKLIEKRVLLSKSELSIWLDSYDDIYSDFDSRPFSERALSDDFINEAKKMVKEKAGGTVSLKLLMPEQQRERVTEEIIVKNLHTHFRKFASQLQNEMKLIRKKGIKLGFLGMIIMIGAAYIINLEEKNFFMNALRVIMEPAGWFLVWTGLDHIFYLSRSKQQEFDFMSRMAHAEITFLSF